MPSAPHETHLAFACELAAMAESVAKRTIHNPNVSLKADGSEVTDADIAIQRLVAERVCRCFPDHALVAEEDDPRLATMPAPDKARFCWVVDPLDGTRNYVRGIPLFATSIALLENGKPVVGVIRELITGTLYSAVCGGGAFRDGQRIAVADCPAGKRPVLSYQPDDAGQAYADTLDMIRSAHIRNLGSTTIHLALVAAGALDGAFGLKAGLWDVAAGAILVEEAGGRITDPDGSPLFPRDMRRATHYHVPFLAAASTLHDHLRRALDG